MSDTLMIVLLVALGPIVVGVAFLALLGATVGRRAREGRRAGRYTSRPGNSSSNW
ncbi:hypothetical protein OG948_42405 (plasmid) [Embleya sp. NBC_00888]|uniref:hypothetical protein n=1 Tax=Embleya sp. NBC_00888 TaxID=2975960 RepID=UPI002F9152E0|nr:hypothetical protein OG948_42405 [Embleya sp. NBC_00888]